MKEGRKERRKRKEGSGLEEQSDKILKAIGMLTKTYRNNKDLTKTNNLEVLYLLLHCIFCT